MDKNLQYVRVFHKTYGHPIHDDPYIHNEKVNKLRVNLLYEELGELCQALKDKDEVEVLDALCDLQYVLDGAFISLGYHNIKSVSMKEVQRSNMSKLNEDGKPIIRLSDGKILKGKNYSPPNLKDILG